MAFFDPILEMNLRTPQEYNFQENYYPDLMSPDMWNCVFSEESLYNKWIEPLINELIEPYSNKVESAC